MRTVSLGGMGNNSHELHTEVNANKTRNRFEYSVCHANDLDTLLVSSHELSDIRVWLRERWQMALRRIEKEWREAQSEQNDSACEEAGEMLLCALNDSRSLVFDCKSEYLKLFPAKSGQRTLFIYRIEITKDFVWFLTTCGSTNASSAWRLAKGHGLRVTNFNGSLISKSQTIQVD